MSEIIFKIDCTALSKSDQLRFRQLMNEGVKISLEPQWIPVTERLPEKSGYYQVYYGKHVPWSMFWNGSAWVEEVTDIEVFRPTHWMPLPEPPE